MAKGYGRMPGGNKGQKPMMSQLQAMQQQMEAIQAQLAEETVTATAGGGVVKVTMTGQQHCRAVEIDPSLLEDADVEMLQDLIVSAVNLALEKSTELANERMGPVTGGLSGMGLGF
jgi:DNA-binding YbaB/EbfC family protein